MSLAQQAIQRNNFTYAREKLLAHLPEKGWPDLRGWEWRYLWKAVEAQNSEAWSTGKPVYSVAVSPGSVVAGDVGPRSGGIFVFDLVRHQVITNFSASGGGPQYKRACVFSPDGSLLAMARSNGVLLAHSGRWETEKFESKRSGKVVSLAFYPDGGTLLAGSTSGLKAWKVPSGQETELPMKFTHECRHLEISPDGRWVAVSTLTNVVAWSLPGGVPVLADSLGSVQVESIALSRQGWLAACDRDGRVWVWDLNATSGTNGATNLLVRLDTHARGPNYAAAFSSDGSLLAVAGSQLIRVYNTSDWRKRNEFRGHEGEIWGLAFTPNGAQLVSGGKDALRIWNPQALPETGELPGTWLAVGFSRDSKRVATLTSRRVLQFWQVNTLALDSTFHPPTDLPPTSYVIISPDEKMVVSRSGTNTIHVFDREQKDSVGKLKLDPTGLLEAIPWQCSPDSSRVVVEIKRRRDGRTDRTAEVFDLKTLERVVVVENLKPLSFSPDGRFIGGKNPEVTVVAWDLKQQRRREFVGATEKVNNVTFSGNGLIAASGDDHVIRIWDVASGQLRSTLKGHRGGVGRIVFSRDNRTLFSGGTDRALKAWNVATGQEVLSIEYERDTWELALSPDDTTLAIGGILGLPQPVVLVRAPSLAEIDAARKRENR
jgi:WD40 repeat protein